MNSVRTETAQIVFEVVGEMVPFPHRSVKEINIYDVVCILVSNFNDTDHVVCLEKNHRSHN